jgi:hypothetical protein
MPQFTVGSYLATRLEQIGVKHYFVVVVIGVHQVVELTLGHAGFGTGEP